MKTTLLATTTLCALAALPASAADLGARMVTKAPVVEQPFSWAGLYIGAHGGYASADYTVTDITTAGDNAALRGSGGIFGAQVGYNAYLGRNWVLGYELDLSGASLKDSAFSSMSTVPTESKIDYFGTMRTRVGYAVDHWLLYATAGAAWAHNKVLSVDGSYTYTRDQFLMGWTAGAGVEYAFDRNWSIKAEYLYADLGDNPQTLVNGVYKQNTDTTLQIVRVGVNYRFDNSAPASAAAPAYPVKARPLAVTSWGGGYIGAHGGYVWNDVDAVLQSFVPNTASLKADGGFAGFTTGYNWLLTPSWLVGLESETSFAWTETNGATAPDPAVAYAKVNYFGSERARLGYVAGDMLFYATGGLAWAKLNFDTDPLQSGYTYGLKQYRIGWTAGGGVEWMVAPQWSAKLEYLHADYGTYESRTNLVPTSPWTAKLTSDSVKVGVNYHGDILGALFR